MNVVVVGSGIAGKAVAAYLRRLNVVKKVTIVQERAMNDDDNHNKHLTTGLWGPALACFHELGLSKALLPLLQPVGPSGYTSVGGAWLARPVAEAPLAFINNDALLRTLDDHLVHSRNPGDVEVAVYRGRAEGLDEVHPNAATVALTTSCATAASEHRKDRHHAHLIVAADGLHSTVRTLLLDSRQEPSPVRYRGYRVYRGHAAAGPTGQRVASEAFQTWGAGARFACVPTVNGNAWFAAIAGPPSDTDMALVGPFANGSYPVGQEGVETLQTFFRGWHSPIPALLDRTISNSHSAAPDSGVIGCDAWAHSFCSSREYMAARRVTRAIATSPFGQVALVGDAAYTLDPILAQGAGTAVEDARLLYRALYTRLPRDPAAFAALAPVTQRRLVAAAIDTLDAARRRRVRLLALVSDVSQGIGQLPSPFLCGLRDGLLRAVPQAVKGPVFDAAIRAVSAPHR